MRKPQWWQAPLRGEVRPLWHKRREIPVKGASFERNLAKNQHNMTQASRIWRPCFCKPIIRGPLNLVEALFAKFHEQLAKRGYVARAGQMIDATFVEVPRQRNSREENAGIKAGAPPEAWKQQPTKRRQKDMDARWTKKNNETHYGYKNHINADEAHKLVQSYAVSDAAVHDSQVFEVLLDQTVAEFCKLVVA